ncbi:MAG: two-component system sensor histidine kinase CreC, partial [Oceanococcus sp.]
MSIRSRIFAVFVLALVLGSYAFFSWLRDDMRPRYMEAQEDILVDTAWLLASQIEAAYLQRTDEAWQIDTTLLQASFQQLREQHFEAQIYSLLKTAADIRVYVTDAQGIAIFDSQPQRDLGRDMSQWHDVERTLRGEYGARSSQDELFAEGSTMYVAAPIRADGDIVGVVSVGKTTRNAERFLDSAIPRFVGAAVASLGLALLLAFALNWWVTRPLYQLQLYARQLQSGKPQAPPKLRDKDMARVALAMSELRQALDGKQYVEDYIQALTHELKSPSAAIAGAAELLREPLPEEQRQRFLNNIDKEARRLSLLLERMLSLAEIENRDGLQAIERVDLVQLVSEACESLIALVEQKNLTVHIDAPDALFLRGEGFLLQRAVLNLLHNAMDFSSQQGRIEVVIRSDEATDIATICIRDHGSGLPTYALTRVFERFYS